MDGYGKGMRIFILSIHHPEIGKDHRTYFPQARAGYPQFCGSYPQFDEK
jgi:hypothetical protein